jgi:hypothetical protein
LFLIFACTREGIRLLEALADDRWRLPITLAEKSAVLAQEYINDRRVGAISSDTPKQAEAMIVFSKADRRGTSDYHRSRS